MQTLQENLTTLILIAALFYMIYERKPKIKKIKTAREMSEEVMLRTYRTILADIENAQAMEDINQIDDDIFEFGQLYQYNHSSTAFMLIEMTDRMIRKKVQIEKRPN